MKISKDILDKAVKDVSSFMKEVEDFNREAESENLSDFDKAIEFQKRQAYAMYGKDYFSPENCVLGKLMQAK